MGKPRRTGGRINITPGEGSERALALPKEWMAVTFEDPGQQMVEALPELPGDFGGKRAKAAPSGLSPAAAWGGPGEFLAGIYRGVTPNVGPHRSNLYTIVQEDTGEVVAVWGGDTEGKSGNILDKKIAFLKPQDGDKIFIGYLGDVGGGEGKNPARDFHVVVVPGITRR